MERAYLGESFIQVFDMFDADDKTRRVDSATFKVVVNGETVQEGSLSMDDSGHVGSFRFVADHVGVHQITVTYRMGDDVWRTPFLMEVLG